MHLLPEGVDKVEGAPNFRQVNGFPVFGVGQPTEEGFLGALEKVAGSTAEPPEKILWFNVRQEPDVYVNGEPVCARPPNKIGEYAELGAVTADMLSKVRNMLQIFIEMAGFLG